jgi:hypothetical protein
MPILLIIKLTQIIALFSARENIQTPKTERFIFQEPALLAYKPA